MTLSLGLSIEYTRAERCESDKRLDRGARWVALLKGKARVDDCPKAARARFHDDNRAFTVSEGRRCRLLKIAGGIGFDRASGPFETNQKRKRVRNSTHQEIRGITGARRRRAGRANPCPYSVAA